MLSIEGMSKSYGDAKAAQDVGFGVERGDVFGLLGAANGAGKTTTVRMILDIVRTEGAFLGPENRSRDCRAGSSATCPKSAASART